MTTTFGLTAAAEGIHLGQMLDPRYPGYWTAECVEITGPVEVERLAGAVAATVVDAEALHARFPDGTRQVVDVDPAWWPEIVPLTEGESWSAVRSMIDDRIAGPADLARGPVFGSTLFVAPGRVYWLIRAHHIVLDGFGYALLYRQVTQRYNGTRVEPFGRLREIVDDDDAYRAGDTAGRDRDYWCGLLDGVPPTGFTAETALPQRHTIGTTLPASILDDAGAVWPHRLLACVAATLHRRTGATTPVLGLPVSGRLGTPAARVPGMVMNIAPLPIPIGLSHTLDDVTATVAAALKDSRRHQRYRYEWLRGDLELPAGGGRVFGPVVNVIPFAEPPEFTGCDVHMHHVSAGPVDDIAVTARGPASLTVEANPALYTPGQLSSIRDELLDTAHDGGRVAHWTVIDGPPLPPPLPLPWLIDRHHPDAIAIEDGPATLTYGELRRRAHGVATELAAAGVRPGDLVAVARPRDADTIATMLGVLNAGAGYLPIDPDGAAERNTAILAEAAPAVTIDAPGPTGQHTTAETDPAPTIDDPRPPGTANRQAAVPDTRESRDATADTDDVGSFPATTTGAPNRTADAEETPARFIPASPTAHGKSRAAVNGTTAALEDDNRGGARVSEGVPTGTTADSDMRGTGSATDVSAWNGEATAYVIYTSGSTGRPKGVSVPRSALDFFVASASRRYGFTGADRVLQFAPLHFDAHVEEIFVSLACGATVVVRDDSATQSLSRFTAFVTERGITVLDLPTAYWHELVVAMRQGLVTLPDSVATVIIGGEAAMPQRLRQWHEAVGDRVRLINTYGPTEATVVCLAGDLAPGDEANLGTPLPGVRAAIGPAGELHISGPGLATGYLGATPDTPFITVDSERWYRTGDIVDDPGDGRLRYRGRADEELKISGHRIHPSEVEVALLSHPQVREAVITVDRSAGTRLIAHVTTAPESRPTADDVRAHVGARLPEVAVPAAVDVRDALPRTPNGKIDRRALARLERAEVAEPRDPAERRVLEVFGEVLGVRPSSLDADFFSLGGTSLSAVAAAARLSGKFGREVTAAELFAHPTVAGLAMMLSGAEPVADEAALMREDRVWRYETEPCLPNGDDAITITGATGFVGAHLLSAVLSATDVPVRCLVRGGGARLWDAARRFGLPEPDGSRITVIEGDLSRPVLGLDTRGMSLISDSRAIVNCAANVGFARGYRGLRDVNVEAVRTLLELACVGGSSFHQISTVSVGAGGGLPEEFIDEHPGLSDGYQRTKWVAEELVRQAGRAGLPVACHRLGRVVPTAGAHNPDDFVVQLIRAGMALGCLPDMDVSEPWIAADLAATCIAQAVERQHMGMWNLGGQPVRLTTVWDEIRREHPHVGLVPMPRWRELLGTRDDTAILKSFFDVHHQGPPRDHHIHDDRFRRWLGRSQPAIAPIDWVGGVARVARVG